MMFPGVKRSTFALAAAVMLSACASDIPPAPKHVAEPWPGSAWETPPETAAIKNRPRATTFAGVSKLPEPFYSNQQLHRNFLSIAMRAEAADDVDSSGNISIAKWVKPLRYQLVGATADDAAKVTELAARIRTLTGMDIAPATARNANVRLNFVPFRHRDNAVFQLAGTAKLGRTVASMVTRWRDAEREKCLGLISIDPSSGAIAKAEILIKDELPPRIRDACIVEEIVQSLGLMNDDPNARPSIFNDSQEFLDLTSHDEFLLRILYDPRVRPGMILREMNPLAEQIIREIRPLPTPAKDLT